ncbi:MAG: hypothetical protein BWX58_01114 [Deltaproteobacteria bacterium ADurb.Bin026]|nr:MAG: hypothetical protein BWX58_01114 [Deltaproteobacteria bacterium ADurb.Bin026]
MLWTILPGIEPTYVLLWPLISASSFTPPSDILTNFLPIALAIDFPSEVFPTPGGPTKQIMGPLISPFNFMTLKNSSILSLTFSRSKWSSSRTFFAIFISILSFVDILHGSSTSHSIYVLIMEDSIASGCIMSSRSSCFFASFSISFGILAFFILLCRSSISSVLSSLSPSSFLIAFICSLRK